MRSTAVFRNARLFSSLVLVAALGVVACEPRVQVAAPDKPITINLNIKLDADIRLKLEDAAKRDIEKNPEIF
jgi:hypothetical protein